MSEWRLLAAGEDGNGVVQARTGASVSERLVFCAEAPVSVRFPCTCASFCVSAMFVPGGADRGLRLITIVSNCRYSAGNTFVWDAL